MRKIKYILLCSLMILLCGCGKEDEKPSQEAVSELDVTEQVPMADTVDSVTISVWPTYWDTETVMDEITVMQEEIDCICYFAAYFNEEQELFIPNKSLQTKADVEKVYADKQWTSYLTVVNDLLLKGGGSSLKDTTLLYQMLENPTNRTNHIYELMKLVKENDFDGIEIDYEAIKKDMQLWEYFIAFLVELNEETVKQGIQLRVLLEPGAPIEQLEFPDGPEYVMMCYNLNGYGTEPGPKANSEFIQKMAKKMEVLPGRKGMAFSVGGFDFAQDGSVAQLTETQCKALLEQHSSEVRRDEASHALIFDYIDENAMSHQVWYGDTETLKYWIEEGMASGFQSFSIWRLGSFTSLLD